MAIKIAGEEARLATTAEIIAGLGNYVAIGATRVLGTANIHPVKILYILNRTDADLWFSYDGVTDHFPIAAGSFLIKDYSTNKDTNALTACLQQGDSLWVKPLVAGVFPTVGNVYFSSDYID
jgi:hypothetical protein